MCGLLGYISNKKQSASTFVEALSEIKHRGPDDTMILAKIDGEFLKFSTSDSNRETRANFSTPNGKESNAMFGFNRLALLDKSHKSMQPFHDKTLGLVFMMVGEVYNYQQIKQSFALEMNSEVYSDSQVVFELYKKLGDDFIHYLRGMFAISIWNTKSRELILWRDRFGVKNLFYTFKNGDFAFASEVKPIHGLGLTPKEPNIKGLLTNFYLGTCYSPLTVYENIHSLPPASKLVFSQATQNIQLTQYWNLKFEENEAGYDKDELKNDFTELTKLVLTGSDKKYVMLSGGLDSGLLAQHLAAADKGIEAIHMYPNTSVNELEEARMNAASAGVLLHEFSFKRTLEFDEALKMASLEEEPSTSPEVNQIIGEHAKTLKAKVLISAIGLDELFGGYKYYWEANRLNGLESLMKIFRILPLPTKYKKFYPLAKWGLMALPFVRRNNSPFELYTSLILPEFFGDCAGQHPMYHLQHILLENNLSTISELKKISYLDLYYYVSQHHAIRGDRSLMLHGIEGRVPFLDHLFIQKWFNRSRIFDDLDKTNNKPLIRRYAKGKLNAKVLDMNKMGFSSPWQIWAKNDALQSKMKEYILDTNPIVFWNRTTLEKILENSDNALLWQLFSTTVIFGN